MDEEAKKEALLRLSRVIKELPKGEMQQEPNLKKDSSPLVQALLEGKREELKRDLLHPLEMPKKEPKQIKEGPKKDESIKSAKEGTKPLQSGVILQKALEGKEQSVDRISALLKDESVQNEGRKDEGKIKNRVGHFELEGAHKHQSMEFKAKMAVASEALKNFSKDLWEVVENYRPPLMKVSMELNPQNLGSVDVTLISRGQNLIVNISSGQETMQMFMQNIQEFRQNLMAQGFVSLQMNFNFSDQRGDSQREQWQKEAAKKYAVSGEEIGKIGSLDIIVPHPRYA